MKHRVDVLLISQPERDSVCNGAQQCPLKKIIIKLATKAIQHYIHTVLVM